MPLCGQMTAFIEHWQLKHKFKVIINKAICTKYCGAQLKMVAICHYIYVCMYIHHVLPWIQGLLCRQLTASDTPSWQLRFSFCIPKNKEWHIGKLIWFCFYISLVFVYVFLSKQPFLLLSLKE